MLLRRARAWVSLSPHHSFWRDYERVMARYSHPENASDAQ